VQQLAPLSDINVTFLPEKNPFEQFDQHYSCLDTPDISFNGHQGPLLTSATAVHPGKQQFIQANSS
jgi:hypothetical protein